MTELEKDLQQEIADNMETATNNNMSERMLAYVKATKEMAEDARQQD